MRHVLGLTFALLCPATLGAQGADEATFVLRAGRTEVGREAFRILDGRGRGLPGSTLAITAEYPAGLPERTFAVLLSRTPDGGVTAFQVERASRGDTTRIVGEVAGGRVTVRSVHGAIESARQYPAGPGLVILADSVHSLLAQVGTLATEAGRQLSGLHPLTGRRSRLTATLAGTGSRGGPIVEVAGDLTATVEFDAEGRLLRVTPPAPAISAVRAGS
jgi:hypothetical protein